MIHCSLLKQHSRMSATATTATTTTTPRPQNLPTHGIRTRLSELSPVHARKASRRSHLVTAQEGEENAATGGNGHDFFFDAHGDGSGGDAGGHSHAALSDGANDGASDGRSDGGEALARAGPLRRMASTPVLGGVGSVVEPRARRGTLTGQRRGSRVRRRSYLVEPSWKGMIRDRIIRDAHRRASVTEPTL